MSYLHGEHPWIWSAVVVLAGLGFAVMGVVLLQYHHQHAEQLEAARAETAAIRTYMDHRDREIRVFTDKVEASHRRMEVNLAAVRRRLEARND